MALHLVEWSNEAWWGKSVYSPEKWRLMNMVRRIRGMSMIRKRSVKPLFGA